MSRNNVESVSVNDKRWLILRAKVHEENIKTAFRLFQAHGISPILIKGWAAAREYPESYLRNSSDIDLCVAPEDFERSRALIATEAGNKLNIDLHKGLRHLDTAGWEWLFQNSESVLIDNVPVRVLRAEDHLRVLCVHWLTDGGAEQKRLLDIYYLLSNRADRFDWDYCFAAVDRNRRDWIVKTVAITAKFYQLDISKIPFAAELESVPDWFTKALEREWASETKLRDIHTVFGDRSELWQQVKKRLRPNPIQSTVLMEGKFDQAPRIYYQIGSFLIRLKPSLKKAFRGIKYKFRRIKNDE